MRRGDIYLFDYEPVKGSEANKPKRPSVIVSPDELNLVVDEMGAGVLTVVPLSSNTAFLHDYHTLLPAKVTQLGVRRSFRRKITLTFSKKII